MINRTAQNWPESETCSTIYAISGAPLNHKPRTRITPWGAASGARSQVHTKNDFWISRYLDGPGVTGDFATTANGRMRTFRTLAAAQIAADKLNRASGEPQQVVEEFTATMWRPESEGGLYKVGDVINSRGSVYEVLALEGKTAMGGQWYKFRRTTAVAPS